LQGHGSDAHTHAVAINAGCALYLCGLSESVKMGTALALSTIKTGKAFELLHKLATVSSQSQE